MDAIKLNDKSSKATTFSGGAEAQTTADGEHPLKPKHIKRYKQNWRINLLATPKSPRGKYTYPPDVFDSGVSDAALKSDLPDRIEQMSRPPLRRLVVNKHEFMPLHKEYEERMDHRIELSWNSIYNCYKKARRDLSRKSSASSKRSRSSKSSRSSKGKAALKDAKVGKGGKKDKKGKEKGGKGDKKKGKKQKGRSAQKTAEKEEEDIEKEREEWVTLRAQPKKLFKPEPIPRGPIADLVEIKERLDNLATAKKVQMQEPKELPIVIPESALTYQITDTIAELAKPSPWRLVKEEPYVPGSVKPEALLAKATPRLEELAKPKVTQSENDTDVKDDPFAISPNALKYVATSRIIELAKPVER